VFYTTKFLIIAKSQEGHWIPRRCTNTYMNVITLYRSLGKCICILTINILLLICLCQIIPLTVLSMLCKPM
jgi:hypothetical protein